MPKFEVSVVAQAAIHINKTIRAGNSEEAKQWLNEAIKKWALMESGNMPEVNIVEPPIVLHDFRYDDIVVSEIE